MLVRPALSPVMMMRLGGVGGVGIHTSRPTTTTTLRIAFMMKSKNNSIDNTMFQKMTTLTSSTSMRISRKLSGGISPLLFSNSSSSATISLRSLSFAGIRFQQSFNNSHSSPSSLSPYILSPLGTVAYYSSGRRGGAPSPPKGGGGRMGWAGGALGVGALLLGKGKYLLGALKIGKLSTMASMILSVGAYSMVFGLPYACGMVGLIFVHESKFVK